MGVTGLWRLIEPSGRPVPLETLENKVLAIDVSIWLHQAIKGFQDNQGGPLPNAHLLGVYHRVCKLLYFKIRPVFVFDGGVPALKKETISKRNQQKSKKLNEADRIQKQLLSTLLKHSAVNQVLSETAKSALRNGTATTNSTKQTEDIYKLPPTVEDLDTSFSDDESSGHTKQWDLHTIDEKSPHFKSLPVDIRHEILTELKETRKQNSWGRIHELPKQIGEFSGFQMKRLLKRYSVQATLEEVEKEMGGCSMSLAELEALMNDQGVVTNNDSVGKRIASNEHVKYLLIKDVRKAIKEAKQQELELKNREIEDQTKEKVEEVAIETEGQVKADDKKVEENAIEIEGQVKEDELEKASTEVDLDYEQDLEQAIQLSLQDVASTSKVDVTLSQWSLYDGAEKSSESEEDSYDLTTAKNFMKEYSGLTNTEIIKIIGENAIIPKIKSTTKKITKNPKIKAVDLKETIVPVTITDSSHAIGLEDASSVAIDQIEAVPIIEKSVHSIRSETKSTSNVETVELMSDSNSDSSDDFLEVEPAKKKLKKKEGLQILINHEDVLEDDIFSDIFANERESKSSRSINLQNLKKSTENIKSTLDVTPQAGKDSNSTTNETSLQLQAEENNTSTTKAASPRPLANKDSSELLANSKEALSQQETDDKLKTSNSDSINLETESRQDEGKYLEKPEKAKPVLTTIDLVNMEDNLRKETDDLISGMNSKERMANSLSDQMYQEAQELLKLFGIPYIVAPMEAEAQCAFLEYAGLTNGTITDDSDIWLFGGNTVYKNFFDQRKHVMEYQSENILQHFKLTREQMILLALLVGSDYTTGIQGIGPVTALEILAAFPSSKSTQTENDYQRMIYGLEQFRKWLEGETKGLGRVALRNKLKNVQVIDSFPSVQVVRAYLKPTIDDSKEPFSWAKPDVRRLTEFARKKFGWPHAKSEKILDPVLKRLNEVRMQKSIKDYFATKHKIDSGDAERKMSKRVKTAVGRLGNSDQVEEEKVSKKKTGKRRRKVETTTEDIDKETAGLSSDEDVQVLKETRIQSKEKLQQITRNVKSEIEKKVVKKPRTIADIHKKEVIPQKEKDKISALRVKMKAIETFRKSKLGPDTYAKKKKMAPKKIKEDAELSESSSD